MMLKYKFSSNAQADHMCIITMLFFFARVGYTFKLIGDPGAKQNTGCHKHHHLAVYQLVNARHNTIVQNKVLYMHSKIDLDCAT